MNTHESNGVRPWTFNEHWAFNREQDLERAVSGVLATTAGLACWAEDERRELVRRIVEALGWQERPDG